MLEVIRSAPGTLALRGELDLSTSQDFLRQAQDGWGPDGVLVLDLRGLLFMDAAGAHALVSLSDSVPRLVVRHPRWPVLRLIQLLDLPGRRANLLVEPEEPSPLTEAGR